MLVACLLYKYFPYGGLQRDFIRISRELESRGHKIRVYVQNWQGEKPASFEIIDVPEKALSNHQQNEAYYEYVKKHLLQNPVDVIVGFNKMPGLDVYYQADTCYEEKARNERGFLYRLLARYKHYHAFEQATFGHGQKTQLMMISSREKEVFKKHYQTEEERFHLLPPGISPDRLFTNIAPDVREKKRAELQIDLNDFIIIQVGSDFQRKGVDRTLLSLVSLPKEILDKTHLLVIGQDKPDKMAQFAANHRCLEHVRFLSGRSDVPELLAASDVFMHPAYSENTGTVILEAMCAGVPSIVTDICGFAPYVKDSQSGLVIDEPFNQALLNNALCSLLTDDKKRLAMAQKAKDYALSHDLYSMPEKAADIIINVAQEKVSQHS